MKHAYKGLWTLLFTFILTASCAREMIESLLMAIGFLTSAGAFTSAMISFMPPIIGTSIAVFAAIFLIKFLIGR